LSINLYYDIILYYEKLIFSSLSIILMSCSILFLTCKLTFLVSPAFNAASLCAFKLWYINEEDIIHEIGHIHRTALIVGPHTFGVTFHDMESVFDKSKNKMTN